jgi:hypothetical protein
MSFPGRQPGDAERELLDRLDDDLKSFQIEQLPEMAG